MRSHEDSLRQSDRDIGGLIRKSGCGVSVV
jgi:hypothetical protein